MDGKPNRRNKAAFSNFSGVVKTLPLLYPHEIYLNCMFGSLPHNTTAKSHGVE